MAEAVPRRSGHGRFWWWHVAVPAAVFVVGLALLQTGDRDARLTDPFFDPASGVFPLRRSWLYDRVGHAAGKWLALVAFVGSALGGLAAFVLPRLRSWRWALLYIAVSGGLATGIIGVLKKLTDRPCPWDYDRWGGRIPYPLPWYASPPAGTRFTDGFPAGHAAGAFALCAIYFVARARGVRHAWVWLLPSALLGAAFAWTQHVRGAHLASHNLWTMAICWAVAIGLAALADRSGLRLDGQATIANSSRATEK